MAKKTKLKENGMNERIQSLAIKLQGAFPDDEELLSFLKSGIERYCKIESSDEICGLKLLSSSDIKGDISNFGNNLLLL